MHPFVKTLSAYGVLPVINIPSPEAALPLADALIEGGLPLLEVTLRNPTAMESLALIRAKRPEITLLAGTVRNKAQVAPAIDAGARCIVAPGLNPDVALECARCSVPYLPGCVTPSEMEAGLALGLTTFKFFPAEEMGGVKTLKLTGPAYPEVAFVPTGGITAQNLGSYLALPQVIACGGSFMAPKALIEQQMWSDVIDQCRACLAIARRAKAQQQ